MILQAEEILNKSEVSEESKSIKPINTGRPKIRRHPGVGRPCPRCFRSKPFGDSGHLKKHLMKSCPSGIISDEFTLKNERMESKNIALKRRIEEQTKKLQAKEIEIVSPTKVDPVLPNVIIYNSNQLPGTPVRANPSLTRTPLAIETALEAFRESFSDPLIKAKYRAESTNQMLFDNVRRLVEFCKFQTIEDFYSRKDKIREYFSIPRKGGTHKSICQGAIEFVEFLETCDALADLIDDKRHVQLLSLLKKAYLAFCRQASVDDVARKAKTSELIRLGQYPTYSEVSESFHQLSKTVMSDDFWKQVIALINSTV